MDKTNLQRCSWVNLKNELYIHYHDQEWGIPKHDDTELFEMLILESFQAGLSWECILNKRKGFKEAFENFDVNTVASYDVNKIESLYKNSNIVRNKGKIKASVQNARIFKTIQKQYGSFDQYLWNWTQGKIIYERGVVRSPLSDAISQDLKKRGMSFVGTKIIYAYLQSVGMIWSHDRLCFLSINQK